MAAKHSLSEETAWAAGLFEGEGSVYLDAADVRKRNGKLRIGMSLSSTDEDVVRRFHAALGAGYTPIEAQVSRTSLSEGLATAETQTLTKQPRVPLPDDDVADEDPGAPPFPETSEPTAGLDVAPAALQVISQAQRRRMFAIAREQGVTEEHLRDLIREKTGSETTAEMSVEDYDELVALIESRMQMTV